jgi:hypothetical protein
MYFASYLPLAYYIFDSLAHHIQQQYCEKENKGLCNKEQLYIAVLLLDV